MTDTISVMVNECYHGLFGLSDIAIVEYNKRKPRGVKSLDRNSSNNIDRADQLMVQICREMGSIVNRDNKSNIQLKRIPLMFLECYNISEYDGFESVNIDFYKYQIDSIRFILENDAISNDDKINLSKLALTQTHNLIVVSSDEDDEDTEEEKWPVQ